MDTCQMSIIGLGAEDRIGMSNFFSVFFFWMRDEWHPGCESHDTRWLERRRACIGYPDGTQACK